LVLDENPEIGVPGMIFREQVVGNDRNVQHRTSMSGQLKVPAIVDDIVE
jgi:hypothetical protein